MCIFGLHTYAHLLLNLRVRGSGLKSRTKKLLLLLFGIIPLAVAVYVHSVVLKNETEPGYLWMQPAVCGFDNCGTATYEDGILYAPSKGNDNVYAIEASNGQILWNRTVRQCNLSPRIDGEAIYVGETGINPRALALRKASGTVIWQFIEPENKSWIGSPLVNGDYVYYTTYGSGVYALNKTNGNTIWHNDIGELVCPVTYHNGTVFVSGYRPKGQYALNATTGEEIWHVDHGGSWESSSVIYEGMIIQVTFEINTSMMPGSAGRKIQFRRNVYSTCVLNETNGELIREFEDRGSPNTPLVYNGRIFVPDDDNRIWAFDLITGEKLWSTVTLFNGSIGGQKWWVTAFPNKPAGPQDLSLSGADLSYCSPAAYGGAIYYQSQNGTFYVINETDGSIHWSYPLNGIGFGSPSIGNGCVFITNDFALYAFKIDPDFGDYGFHRSFSEHGVECIKLPSACAHSNTDHARKSMKTCCRQLPS